MEKVYNRILPIAKLLIFISGALSLYTIIRFTKLNILYYPDEHNLVAYEYKILFASICILLLSRLYKMKYTKIIAFMCIIISVINFTIRVI